MPNKPTTLREFEEKFRKQFRELLISLSDITTNNDTSRPLKGDIYFDGIETEQWILNFFLSHLTSHNTELLRKIEGLRKDRTYDKKDSVWDTHKIAFNQALDQVINIINQEKD